MSRRASLLAWLALAAAPLSSQSAVRVVVGPTPIIDGQATSSHDITLVNEKLAVAIAVESPVPYGVPRGAIIDVAPVRNGVVGHDCVVFADFIPNNWSAWPNTYRHVEIVENTPGRAVIRSIRDWGKVSITTTYTLVADADTLGISTTMKNEGETLTGLLSGMTLWPSRGFLLAVPGLAGVEQGTIDGASGDRVVAYDADWAVTLHAPYADHVGDGSKDLYLEHTLVAGESRVFDSVLQVGASGDLQPVLANEVARRHLPSGTVHGVVAGRDRKLVEQPVLVIEKNTTPYAWTIGQNGRFDARLPSGAYTVYATAKGYSQSEPITLTVGDDSHRKLNFSHLAAAGRLALEVSNTRTGEALDARIDITQGQQPVVQFLGRKTFFTEFGRKGRLDAELAPGHYVFAVSSGGGFLSLPQSLAVDIAPGITTPKSVTVARQIDPPADHWYAADLHHHADQAEAVTPPADLARSELAAGLDLLFVSDHDSMVNHRILQTMADERGIPFIPSIELSASWGHFNAYPLKPGQTLAIDTATATVSQIFSEARRLGASVIQVNHPFIPYGYLTSVQNGVAPGGFNDNFELMEINAAAPEDDARVLQTLWEFWNKGTSYYLAGGTDTHDVWNGYSGAERTFAYVEGAVTAQKYAAALRAGHAYVTAGPIIVPSVLFGTNLRTPKAQPFQLSFALHSVVGLKRADLIERGTVVRTKSFDAAPHHEDYTVDLTVNDGTWYSLTVEDAEGHKAYTDPIWVTAAE